MPISQDESSVETLDAYFGTPQYSSQQASHNKAPYLHKYLEKVKPRPITKLLLLKYIQPYLDILPDILTGYTTYTT